MRLAVIGTGYVGLVTGAGFADFGHDVTCVDDDPDRIARLERGELPVYEPGLDHLVARCVRRGELRFSTQIEAALAGAQVAIIAVGTPPNSAGAAEVSPVLAIADALGPALTGYTVVAVMSTVPVGTCDEVHRRVARTARHPFAVVANPHLLKEGDAINDFMKPDRVIVGTHDERARELMRRLYAPLLRTNDRLCCMTPASAELAKYAGNALLAVRISFMNELALLCERVGADVEDVRRGLGADPRIGAKFLFAGAGYGGSRLPTDLKALLQTASGLKVPLEVVAASERANARQKQVLARKLKQHFLEQGDKDAAWPLEGRTIAVWGLAFKPGTDDLREAPAVALIEQLLVDGARVVAHDPAAMPQARAHFGDRVLYPPGMYQAAEGADALVLVTEWHEFRRPDFTRLRRLMRQPALFDGRNVWDPDEVRRLGFRYHGIGRV
jgi:UDPglucose 6-dehydrogenase